MELRRKTTSCLMLTWMFALAIGMLVSCSGCIHPIWSKCDYHYGHRLRHSSNDPVHSNAVSVQAKLVRLKDYDPEALRNTLLQPYTAFFDVVSGVVPGHEDADQIRLRILDPVIGGNIKVGQIVTFRFLPDGRLVDIADFPPGCSPEDFFNGPDTVEFYKDSQKRKK